MCHGKCCISTCISIRLLLVINLCSSRSRLSQYMKLGEKALYEILVIDILVTVQVYLKYSETLYTNSDWKSLISP